MPCYSHLSDAEREQIGLAKAAGHSIGGDRPSDGRPKSMVRRDPPAAGCRAGATRRFTPPAQFPSDCSSAGTLAGSL